MDDKTNNEYQYVRNELTRLKKSVDELSAPLEMFLKRRSFTVYKKEPSHDLFLPETPFVDDYYQMLHKYSFRLFLRDLIKYQRFFTLKDITKYASPDVTKNYLEYMLSLNMVEKVSQGYRVSRGPIKSFGETLEWYVAEIFKREFSAQSLWGVKFKRPGIGGDYDVLAKCDSLLIYGEVKSSPPKQIYDHEISAFLSRYFDLAPEIGLFFMDTELRMKDKIVPMFEEELKKRFKKPPPVKRMERELFHVGSKLFIINAKNSIVDNLEKVFLWYFRMKNSLSDMNCLKY